IVSDVYRVTARVAGGSVTVKPKGQYNSPSYISMRAPTPKQPGPVFEVLVGTQWSQISTQRTGNDVYSAPFARLGDYALVQLYHPKSTSSSSGVSRKSSGGGGVNVGLIVGGSAVVVAGGL